MFYFVRMLGWRDGVDNTLEQRPFFKFSSFFFGGVKGGSWRTTKEKVSRIVSP